jgi:hypothetical protein
LALLQDEPQMQIVNRWPHSCHNEAQGYCAEDVTSEVADNTSYVACKCYSMMLTRVVQRTDPLSRNAKAVGQHVEIQGRTRLLPPFPMRYRTL